MSKFQSVVRKFAVAGVALMLMVGGAKAQDRPFGKLKPKALMDEQERVVRDGTGFCTWSPDGEGSGGRLTPETIL